MTLQNGYKVIYEIAKDGKRTFYATKSNSYPPRDEAGNIIENEENVVLATFDDVDYVGRTIYEHAGSFYVSAKGETPKYNEDGTPADDRIEGFDEVLVAKDAAEASTVAEDEHTQTAVEDDDDESAADPDEAPEDEE